MHRGIGPGAKGAIAPLLVGHAQFVGDLGIGRIEALGEGANERLQREERPRNIEKSEPFGVVTGDTHRVLLTQKRKMSRAKAQRRQVTILSDRSPT